MVYVYTMTFSIAGFDPVVGASGVAVSSCVPAVGAAVPFVGSGGAVATQSRFNYALGHEGVAALELGLRIDHVLPDLVSNDPAPNLRQVHGVDRHGGTFAHTGNDVKDDKGSRHAPYVSVAGNTLVGPSVLDAMLDAYLAAEGCDLAERLLRALEAGQASGGDRRGRQSAALLIAAEDVKFHHNLRVDEHVDPVAELRRVCTVAIELGRERGQRPRHVPLRLKR